MRQRVIFPEITLRSKKSTGPVQDRKLSSPLFLKEDLGDCGNKRDCAETSNLCFKNGLGLQIKENSVKTTGICTYFKLLSRRKIFMTDPFSTALVHG